MCWIERYLMGWVGALRVVVLCCCAVLCCAVLCCAVLISAFSCLFFAMASVLGECWLEAFGDMIQGAGSVLESCWG
jgi:hypothetical protein